MAKKTEPKLVDAETEWAESDEKSEKTGWEEPKESVLPDAYSIGTFRNDATGHYFLVKVWYNTETKQPAHLEYEDLGTAKMEAVVKFKIAAAKAGFVG